MGTGPGSQPPLKVDPDLLGKYGGQLLTAAGNLPDAPPPFNVTGLDAISQAIADKLPDLEGPIQEALPQLKDQASNTASNVVDAAGRYSATDAQLAADYEKHQFDSTGGSGGGGAAGAGGGADSMSQMGQMMSMPMQMATQAVQMPMQALSALGQVPQGIMQGVQQIGQMTGGLGDSSDAEGDKQTDDGAGQPDDRKDEDKAKQDAQQGAAGGDAKSERAPEPPPKDAPSETPVPQQGSPRHAAPDPKVNL